MLPHPKHIATLSCEISVPENQQQSETGVLVNNSSQDIVAMH